MTNMNIETRDNIAKWENTTNELVNQFLYDYFDDVNPEYFWVGDEIGGVFNYGDYFFGFDTVLACYKLDITEEQLFTWYDFCLSNHSVNISLTKYILSPQERKEAEEKHLEELKERVKSAEKEFKETLEKYKS